MPDHLCNQIVPSVVKRGNETLHLLLNQHPEICTSSVKAPNYFCKANRCCLGLSYDNGLFNPFL